MCMPSVTRTESYPGGSEDITLRCIKGPPEIYPDYVLSRETRGYSPFFEAYTPNSGGSQSQWKNFEHYKSVQSHAASNASNPVWGEVVGFWPTAYSSGSSKDPFVGYVRESQFTYSLPYGDPGRLDGGLTPFYAPSGDGTFVPPPSNLADLEDMALKTILPGIKAEISLPNFIYELKDFRGTIETAKKLLLAPDFIRAVKSLVIPKNASFRGLAGALAGHYLNYSFNLAPLVSDISKIYLALKRTERRLNDFVTRAGRVQSRHFRFAWQEYPDISDDWTYGNRIGFQNQWIMTEPGCQRQVLHDATIFHAQVQYNYNYNGFQAEHARLLGYLDALGINLNPAIIWNALPWSFVVDWVFGISQYLDSLKVSNMEPQINIHRYLWSVLRRRRIVVTTAVRNAYDDSFEYRTTLPMVTQTAYRRQVKSLAASSIESSGLTMKEVSLGAALVIARRRR